MINFNRKTTEKVAEEKAFKTVYCLYRVSTKGQENSQNVKTAG